VLSFFFLGGPGGPGGPGAAFEEDVFFFSSDLVGFLGGGGGLLVVAAADNDDGFSATFFSAFFGGGGGPALSSLGGGPAVFGGILSYSNIFYKFLLNYPLLGWIDKKVYRNNKYTSRIYIYVTITMVIQYDC